MADTALTTLRAHCLALPEAHEVEAWGAPTFRVKNKMFAMYARADEQQRRPRPAVWLHCAAANQQALIAREPDRYFVPPYVGPKGWVGVYLDRRPRWKELDALLLDAFKRVAPKNLLRTLDA